MAKFRSDVADVRGVMQSVNLPLAGVMTFRRSHCARWHRITFARGRANSLYSSRAEAHSSARKFRRADAAVKHDG